MLRINIGCGLSPTAGWDNYDNSLSLRLSRRRLLVRGLQVLSLLDEGRLQALNYYRQQSGRVKWANAAKRIPVADGAANVVYSSHMLEHLDRNEVQDFLNEVLRVLVPRGVLRLVVPDLARLVSRYTATQDADAFIDRLRMTSDRPKRLLDKLAWGMIGPRHHLWMYDGASLCRLLMSNGLLDPVVLPAGQTTIPDPGELDLRERSEESLYVEAKAPAKV